MTESRRDDLRKRRAQRAGVVLGAAGFHVHTGAMGQGDMVDLVNDGTLLRHDQHEQEADRLGTGAS